MEASANTRNRSTAYISGRRPYQPRLFPVMPVAVRRPDGRIDGEAASKRFAHRFLDDLERRGVLPEDVASAAHVDIESGVSSVLRLIPYLARRPQVA